LDLRVKNTNAEMTAEADSGEWLKCPNCGVAFNLSDRERWTGYLHKACGQKIRITNFENQAKPIWCVVGNIAEEIPFGEGKQLRKGTKHFSPGTKIYCYPPLWDTWKGIQVIGRHRGSKQFVTMVINLKWLINYRTKLVYNPHILNELSGYWDETEESKKRAENLIGIIDYWKLNNENKVDENSTT
jgi:uncharacterized C2H2 Zn-finger protein